MLVNTVECKECNTIVYSRTEEDVRECECGRVIVSGGQEHFRYDIVPETHYETKKININTNMNALYEDWDSMQDNFGLIKQQYQRASAR